MEGSEVTPRSSPQSTPEAAAGGTEADEEDNRMYMIYWSAESKEGVLYRAVGVGGNKYCVLVMKPSNSESFAKDLFEELECPVCLEYLVPPITLCASGHNVCSRCKAKLRHCSICRAQFTDIRSISLENLVRKTLNACKYKRHGCQEVMTLAELSRHQPVCEHRKHKCPFSIVGSCTWRGAEGDIRPHLEGEHPQAGDSREIEGAYLACCPNMREDGSWNQVLYSLGEVFMLYIKAKDGLLFVVMLHVGERAKARDYRVECVFETSDGNKKVTSCEVTESYYRDVADIMTTEECTVLRYGFVKKCIHESGSLRFKTTITQV